MERQVYKELLAWKNSKNPRVPDKLGKHGF